MLKKYNSKVLLSLALLSTYAFGFVNENLSTTTYNANSMKAESGKIKLKCYTLIENNYKPNDTIELLDYKIVENCIKTIYNYLGSPNCKKLELSYLSTEDYFNQKYTDSNSLGIAGSTSAQTNVALIAKPYTDGRVYATFDSTTMTGKAWGYYKTNDGVNTKVVVEEINFKDFYANHLTNYIYKNKKVPFLIFNQVLYLATEGKEGAIKLNVTYNSNYDALKISVTNTLDTIPFFNSSLNTNGSMSIDGASYNIKRLTSLSGTNHITIPLPAQNYLEETYSKQLFMQMLSDYIEVNQLKDGYATFLNATDLKFSNKAWTQNKYKKISHYSEDYRMKYYNEGTYHIVKQEKAEDAGSFSMYSPTIKLISFAPTVNEDVIYKISAANHNLKYSATMVQQPEVEPSNPSFSSLYQDSPIAIILKEETKMGMNTYTVLYDAINGLLLANYNYGTLSGLDNDSYKNYKNKLTDYIQMMDKGPTFMDNINQSSQRQLNLKDGSTLGTVISLKDLKPSYKMNTTGNREVYTIAAKYQDYLNKTYFFKTEKSNNPFKEDYWMVTTSNLQMPVYFKETFKAFLKNKQLVAADLKINSLLAEYHVNNSNIGIIKNGGVVVYQKGPENKIHIPNTVSGKNITISENKFLTENCFIKGNLQNNEIIITPKNPNTSCNDVFIIKATVDGKEVENSFTLQYKQN